MMSTAQYPTVIPVPPSSSLLNEHHGPKPKRKVPVPNDRPSYFINPWRSYRAASLSDAWLAYQRGAAIAPAGVKSVVSARADPRNEGNDEEEPLVGPARPKSRVYVRPEFSDWHEDDHEDDWRDPPIEVLLPSWDDTGEERGKAEVTWLGHAGVMVRIPWKGKGKEREREGMCGVLFDPIFSYRSVDH